MTGHRPAAEGLFETDADGTTRLISSCCRRCGARHFPARHSCAECGSEDLATDRTGPRGRIHAHTVVHETFGRGSLPAPYGVALVDFDDGVRARGLVRPDFTTPRIGQDVTLAEVVLESTDDEDVVTYSFVPWSAPGA